MTENREYLKNLWHYSNSRLSSDTNKSYKYMGCFRQQDNNINDMDEALSGSFNLEECKKRAENSQPPKKYFGLGGPNGDRCYIGNTFGIHGSFPNRCERGTSAQGGCKNSVGLNQPCEINNDLCVTGTKCKSVGQISKCLQAKAGSPSELCDNHDVNGFCKNESGENIGITNTLCGGGNGEYYSVFELSNTNFKQNKDSLLQDYRNKQLKLLRKKKIIDDMIENNKNDYYVLKVGPSWKEDKNNKIYKVNAAKSKDKLNDFLVKYTQILDGKTGTMNANESNLKTKNKLLGSLKTSVNSVSNQVKYLGKQINQKEKIIQREKEKEKEQSKLINILKITMGIILFIIIIAVSIIAKRRNNN